MKDTGICIYVCNKLLRGEISAIECYQGALGKIENPRHKESLHLILEDHRNSARALREHVSAMGAIPESDSGIWGSSVQAFTNNAAVLDQSTAMSALILEEEHGITEYKKALNDPDVMTDVKITVSETLIPRLHEHIAVLETIKD